MIQAGFTPKKSNVVILGLTFKENCCDIRNSKVVDVVNRLSEFGIKPRVVDPYASKEDTKRKYGIVLSKLEDIKNVDCVIIAVAHDEFRNMGIQNVKKLFKQGLDKKKVMIDVKGLYDIRDLHEHGITWWRL